MTAVAIQRYPMPMPYGWYAVSYSDELAVGESRAVHYFGQELVLFRTESGRAVLMEAYCPHLGAHLGHGIHEQSGKGGGRIEGENIVCPFHSWKFNPDGECAEVPYAKNMPPKIKGKKCLKSFPVRETNQVIWAWYHPDGESPKWEVIEHDEANSSDWSPLERYEWIIDTHVHADHLTAAPYVREKLGGKTAIGEHVATVQRVFGEIFNEGQSFHTDGSQFDHLFKDGETYTVGRLEARAIHTPGLQALGATLGRG